MSPGGHGDAELPECFDQNRLHLLEFGWIRPAPPFGIVFVEQIDARNDVIFGIESSRFRQPRSMVSILPRRNSASEGFLRGGMSLLRQRGGIDYFRFRTTGQFFRRDENSVSGQAPLFSSVAFQSTGVVLPAHVR